jgi:hypothetical protein
VLGILISSRYFAGDVDSRVIEFLGDLLVGQRLRAVFFLDHLFYHAL